MLQDRRREAGAVDGHPAAGLADAAAAAVGESTTRRARRLPGRWAARATARGAAAREMHPVQRHRPDVETVQDRGRDVADDGRRRQLDDRRPRGEGVPGEGIAQLPVDEAM
ncbi:MAG TPA: hypothetical protein VM367_17805 [Pseudonocardia sp.]|nr:hypothetical protein [Pseudonocardia sp.]